MVTKYVIEGNTIMEVQEATRSMGSLSDLLPRLTSYLPLELNPMPHDLAYIRIIPTQNMELSAQIIVQHTPKIQRINYKNGSASSNAENSSYQLALPYGYFWFDLNGNRIIDPTGEQIMWRPRNWGYLWGKEPFATLATTTVHGAYFPNCWGNGAVCFGTTSVTGNQPLGHFVDQAINTFWTSEFNRDLDARWPYSTMRQWQEASLADEDCWKDWSIWQNEGARSMEDRLNGLNEGNTQWREAIPSSTSNAIPDLRITPTFANVDNWLDALDDNDRARLKEVLDARND